MRSARRGNLSGARERRVAQSTGSGAMRMTTNRSAIPLDRIGAAAALVHAAVQPTPQICWPLLSERCGTEVWVKHENHTPIGAFKIRGGLIYMDEFVRRRPDATGVITATRGNPGQPVSFAARRHGLRAIVVVPRGHSIEKKAALRAFGVALVEHGADFRVAHACAADRADGQGVG